MTFFGPIVAIILLGIWFERPIYKIANSLEDIAKSFKEIAKSLEK